MDLITSMNGEFEGSQFGQRVIAMDYNGDGYDDLIVYALYWNPTGVYSDTQRWGKLYFYWGGPDFDNVVDYVIEAQTNKQLGGYIIENGGDINGDGIDDLVMPKYDAPDNYIAVYFGCANHLQHQTYKYPFYCRMTALPIHIRWEISTVMAMQIWP
jgi:hypothetical protein